jgi:hypothetical protein
VTEPIIRLSQGHLNLLSQCPRKFQNTYLEQLASPVTLDHLERMQWGNRFHLLMQQFELGLPVATPTDAEEAELQACMKRLLTAAPELFERDRSLESFRQSEHRRTLEFQGYLLTAVYDLVILKAKEGCILDWKTYPRPRDRQEIAQHWQTRLYLFVLAETSHLSPEQLSMTYWFVRSRQSNSAAEAIPQSYTFAYNSDLHEQTRQDLTTLLSQLSQWLQDYRTGGAFPQVNPIAGLCPQCTYVSRCQRHAIEDDPEAIAAQPRLEDIEEVVL